MFLEVVATILNTIVSEECLQVPSKAPPNDIDGICAGLKHVSMVSTLGLVLDRVPRQTLAVVCFETSFSWPRIVCMKVMCNPIVWRAEERIL